MPFRISCPNNHSTRGISVHDAAIALSEGRPFGVCKRCGKELQCRITAHPGDPSGKDHSFVVTRAVRLGPAHAGRETFDSFLLVLRESATGKESILPVAYGKDHARRGGETPPLLGLEEWKTLFTRLDAGFRSLEERIRLRAYEIYERNGRRDGHALEDWLQAEAELTKKALRAAA